MMMNVTRLNISLIGNLHKKLTKLNKLLIFFLILNIIFFQDWNFRFQNNGRKVHHLQRWFNTNDMFSSAKYSQEYDGMHCQWCLYFLGVFWGLSALYFLLKWPNWCWSCPSQHQTSVFLQDPLLCNWLTLKWFQDLSFICVTWILF